jgi:hypothetical protein
MLGGTLSHYRIIFTVFPEILVASNFFLKFHVSKCGSPEKEWTHVARYFISTTSCPSISLRYQVR